MTATAAPRVFDQDTIRHDPRVPRLHAPSAEVFHEEFVAKNRPVVLTGVASEWPAFKQWNPDYLRKVAGDAEVTVHYDEDGDFQRWYSPRSEGDRKMRLENFVDIVAQDPSDRRYYMSEHPLRAVSERLLADVDVSRYPYIDTDPAVFIGNDTMMPLHYHGTTEAICCQIIGEKEFILFAPKDTKRMFPHPWWSNHWHFSQVDAATQAKAFTHTAHLGYGDPPANSRFADAYADADPIRIALHPGEILLIPVHWWHVTTCPGFQMNVVWFFKSSMRRWTWPSPGLQMFARLAKFRARHPFTRPGTQYAR